MSHHVRRRLGQIVFAASTLLLAPALAGAQLVSNGATVSLIPGFPTVRGTDTAYDPVNRVYLVISAHGPVNGMFVNEAGAPVSGLVPISSGASGFAQYPRATFSQHAFGGLGGFLVTWHQSDGPMVGNAPSNQIHGRLVSYAATPLLGTDIVLGGSPMGTWWEAAPAAVYSSTSQQFLVVWQAYILGEVHAVRVGANGVPIGAPFLVSDSYARDPGVAWNPYDNEFGVSYSGANGAGASVTFARINPAGSVLRRTVLFQAAGTFITDIAFNLATRNFIVAYAAPSTRTTEVTAAGDVVSHGTPFSSVGSYDGLSLAYNLLSGSLLLVGHFTAEVGGVELDGTGAKLATEQVVTAGGATGGSFYPRVSGNTTLKQWQVAYSRDFAVANSQLVGTGTSLVAPPVDSDLDGLYDYIDACPAAFAQTSNGCPAPGAQLGDINGDGRADIVLEHTGTGMLYSWWLSNGQLVGQGLLTPTSTPGTDWLVVSKDDFTGDGLVDLLLQNQVTGEISLWKMQGGAIVGSPVPVPIAAGPWRIVATPDFNLDGHPDLLWQKYSTGDLYAWLVSWGSAGQFTFLAGGVLVDTNNFPIFGPGADWRVVAVGDLNSDVRADIVFQSQAANAVAAWYMGGPSGINIINGGVLISSGAGPWRVRMLNDMNSDGKLDIVWQNAVTPTSLYAWYMNGAGGLIGSGVIAPGASLNPAWRVVGGK